MKMILAFFLMISSVFAEEELRFKQIFTEVPSTSKLTLKASVSKESLPYWGVILGSTALLYHYDEKLLSEFQKDGRHLNIGNEDNTKSALTIFGHEIIRVPSDTGSFMYFLGDGWMHAGIGAGFYTAGKISQNTRASNTGLMLWHGMLVSTIFNQTLKRSFGRESPEVSTSKRGSWNLFPSFNDYNNKTASFDAMPSGHVMTATLTFTIISERYPEHKKIIYPLYGVWASALMFQMVNNGVHWASDYPLGIAMGYLIGKMSTKMGQKPNAETESKNSWNVVPSMKGLYVVKHF